jgi:hypothetical protein
MKWLSIFLFYYIIILLKDVAFGLLGLIQFAHEFKHHDLLGVTRLDGWVRLDIDEERLALGKLVP